MDRHTLNTQLTVSTFIQKPLYRMNTDMKRHMEDIMLNMKFTVHSNVRNVAS